MEDCFCVGFDEGEVRESWVSVTYEERSRRIAQRGEVRGESLKGGGSYAAARACGLGVARIMTLAFE